MQLVEQGILQLDDGAQTKSLCLELKTLKVLWPDGKLEDKKTAIALRMLLSHTAGFGYSFFQWTPPGLGLTGWRGRVLGPIRGHRVTTAVPSRERDGSMEHAFLNNPLFCLALSNGVCRSDSIGLAWLLNEQPNSFSMSICKGMCCSRWASKICR
jgi:hypothetical protein